MQNNNNELMNKWLNDNSKFIKIKVGQSYPCVYRGMKFDPTGGYEGKPTVRYFLEDLADKKTREFSSSSKVLTSQMMTLVEGDEIIIRGILNDKEKKTYEMQITKRSRATPQAVNPEEGVDLPPAESGTDVPF